MADIAKTVEGRAVVFVANTPRAGSMDAAALWLPDTAVSHHAVAFRADKADERERAAELEADALAFEPPLGIEAVAEKPLIPS